MPKNARTTPDVNAGIEREPASTVPAQPTRTERIKFTALIDTVTAEQLDGLATQMRNVGRHPVLGRYPSRADVLRELVAIAASDDDLAHQVADRISLRHRSAV